MRYIQMADTGVRGFLYIVSAICFFIHSVLSRYGGHWQMKYTECLYGDHQEMTTRVVLVYLLVYNVLRTTRTAGQLIRGHSYITL